MQRKQPGKRQKRPDFIMCFDKVLMWFKSLLCLFFSQNSIEGCYCDFFLVLPLLKSSIVLSERALLLVVKNSRANRQASISKRIILKIDPNAYHSPYKCYLVSMHSQKLPKHRSPEVADKVGSHHIEMRKCTYYPFEICSFPEDTPHFCNSLPHIYTIGTFRILSFMEALTILIFFHDDSRPYIIDFPSLAHASTTMLQEVRHS